jgi:Outer membrane protein beta-barrel domain
MKKLLVAALCIGLTAGLQAQVKKEKTDTTEIKVGEKRVLILPATDSTDVKWEEEDPEEKDKEQKMKLTYWQGIDIGVNMLRTSSGSMNMTGANQWLDLTSNRSLSVRLNLVEEKIRIVKDYVGIVVGAGFVYNSYGLGNNIQMKTSGANPDSTYGVKVDSLPYTYSKNKFRCSYLQVPLLLEFNTSTNPEHNLHISAGVVGSWNMGSLVKREYSYNGKDVKERMKGDYNVRPLNLELMARIGFNNFSLFGTYSLTPLFQDNKGPKVYPVSVGLSISFG